MGGLPSNPQHWDSCDYKVGVTKGVGVGGGEVPTFRLGVYPVLPSNVTVVIARVGVYKSPQQFVFQVRNSGYVL